MKVIFALLCILLTKFTFAFSVSSLPLNAKVNNIFLISDGNDPTSHIHNQLKYLTGNLLEYNSGFSLGDLEIDIVEKKELNNGMIEFRYNVNFEIWWPKEKIVPRSIKVILPNYGDSENLFRFLSAYEQSCSYKVNGQINSYWSYIRPQKTGCPLRNESGRNDLSKEYTTELSSKPQNQSPVLKHSQIWDDNLLKATIVFGRVKKNFEGPSSQDLKRLEDFIFQSHQNLISETAMWLGKDHDILKKQYIFKDNNIVFEYNLFLVNDFGNEVAREVNKTIKDLDYFSYNGHAGMGENIHSIAQNLNISEEKYSIIYLNSCITYGFFTYGKFKRFQKTDFILNAVQNYFGTFFDSNREILKSILERKKSYYDLLNRLPLQQRSLINMGGPPHFSLLCENMTY